MGTPALEFLTTFAASKKTGEQVVVAGVPVPMSPVLVGLEKLSRLRKEKDVLTAEEFYLVGAHFAERSFGDRVFGGEILRWLVRTFPADSSERTVTSAPFKVCAFSSRRVS